MNADHRTMEFTHRWTIDDFEAKTRTFKVYLICLYKPCPYPAYNQVGEKIISNEFFLGGQCASLKVAFVELICLA